MTGARPAETRDYEAMRRVMEVTLPDTYKELMPGRRIRGIVTRFTRQVHRELLALQSLRWAQYDVYVVDDEVVAIMLAWVNPHSRAPELCHEYVLPDCQGYGVGRYLWPR